MTRETRSEVYAIIAILIGVCGCIAAYLALPEARNFLNLTSAIQIVSTPNTDKSSEAITPTSATTAPMGAQGFIVRGNDYLVQHKYDLALADFNKAIELDPKNTWVLTSRGSIYETQHKYDLALADFNKAIELDPKNTLGFIFRGNVYKTQGKYDLALADFNKAIELEPKAGIGFYYRGLFYYSQGWFGASVADFDKGIELAPEFAGEFKTWIQEAKCRAGGGISIISFCIGGSRSTN